MKSRLDSVLAGIRQARAQLDAHPDVFEATAILKVSESALAAIIAEMFPPSFPQPGDISTAPQSANPIDSSCGQG
jgi:hypothetical protein